MTENTPEQPVPAQPAQPATPAEPAQPATPAEPAQPATPAEPAQPESASQENVETEQPLVEGPSSGQPPVGTEDDPDRFTQFQEDEDPEANVGDEVPSE